MPRMLRKPELIQTIREMIKLSIEQFYEIKEIEEVEV